MTNTNPLKVIATRWICECCLQWLANADSSSCIDYWGHTTTHHPLDYCHDLPGDWVIGESGSCWPYETTCAGCLGRILPGGYLHSVNKLGR